MNCQDRSHNRKLSQTRHGGRSHPEKRRRGSPARGQSKGGPSAAAKSEKCLVAECGAYLNAMHTFDYHLPEVFRTEFLGKDIQKIGRPETDVQVVCGGLMRTTGPHCVCR